MPVAGAVGSRGGVSPESDSVFVVRVDPVGGRIEIVMPRPFSRSELDAVRSLPGRRWHAERRVWSAPGVDEPIGELAARVGATRVRVERESVAGADTGLLDRVREGLLVRGYSPNTRKVYLGHVRRFLEWCGAGEVALPDDPERSARAYLLHLVEERRVSRGCHNQVVSALRFLFETVLGMPSLSLRIPRPKTERRIPQVLSPAEVSRLIRSCHNPKHRALLMLLYSAGLRVGEVVKLRSSDLDRERGLLKVRCGKGRKDRQTLLSQRALEAVGVYLAAFPPSGDWLFPGGREARHLHTRTVQRVVSNAARAAGITKHVTTHTLRHSFATHLLEKGTNLRVIQELLGHQSSRTTEIYTHVTKTALEAVRSPLDDLDLP